MTEKIVVLSCNCRVVADNCGKPLGACLRFDEGATDRLVDAPFGRLISKQEAKDIIRSA
jgi:hypothetical protein